MRLPLLGILLIGLPAVEPRDLQLQLGAERNVSGDIPRRKRQRTGQQSAQRRDGKQQGDEIPQRVALAGIDAVRNLGVFVLH